MPGSKTEPGAISAGYQQHAAKAVEPADLAAAIANPRRPMRNGGAASDLSQAEAQTWENRLR